MALAVGDPASTVYNDSSLLNAVHCAFDKWLVMDLQNPNWWYDQIGVPNSVTEVMLILSSMNDMTAYEAQKGSEISYRANYWTQPWDGTNLVWMVQIEIQRGLATNNVTALDQGFNAMWGQVAIQNFSSDGIQVDGAYHFHGPQLLTGSYGDGFTQDILQFFIMANGTEWSMPAEKIDVLAFMLTNGTAWMTQGSNMYDFSTVGRSVARPGISNLRCGISATDLRTLASTANATYAEALVAYANQLSASSNAARLTGNRHYFTVDYMSHRRSNFVATLKMHSIRTIASECDNGENLQGEHLGDGVLNIYSTDPVTGGHEYDTVFPLWDWHYIGGVTAEVDTPLVPCEGSSFNIRKTAFVGGCSDGNYGVAAMDTATHNLTGHRAWFFFDRAIIGVGAGLNDPTPASVATTLASKLLPVGQMVHVKYSNGSIVPLQDGSYSFPASSKQALDWLHAGSIGYIPSFTTGDAAAGDASVGVKFGTVTGDWQSITTAYSGNVTERVITTWLEHGSNLSNASFSYAIVPNVTYNSSFDALPYVCLTNTADIQGLADPVVGVTEVVFWEAGTWTCGASSSTVPALVTASIPGLVVVKITDTTASVTVSNPTLLSASINVTIAVKATGPACSSASGDSTVFNIDLPTDGNFLGEPVSISCLLE